MPDIHWGYGFCIGGVCATDPEEGGVISPGGVGYDINCGVRLLRSELTFADVKPALETLVRELFRNVPTGAGRGGKYKFDRKDLKELLAQGPEFLLCAGTGDRIRHRTHRSPRMPGRSTSRICQRSRARPRL